MFRHFLALERERAERHGHSLLLLLVDLAPRTLEPAHEQTVFDVLRTCVRESDFVGWYDTSRTAGAVLVQGTTTPTPAMCTAIGRRVEALLMERLPDGVASGVRVLQLEAQKKESHA
ncbi:MAG TPA: hypothetical protein VIL35_05355 [Vicinamibacterales bacterium]